MSVCGGRSGVGLDHAIRHLGLSTSQLRSRTRGFLGHSQVVWLEKVAPSRHAHIHEQVRVGSQDRGQTCIGKY